MGVAENKSNYQPRQSQRWVPTRQNFRSPSPSARIKHIIRLARHGPSMTRIIASALLCSAASCLAADLPSLRVADSGRHLETVDGEPFFYLADTAWELFHKLDREEAVAYLDDRAAKGFNVVQAVALAELEGLTTSNAYGHVPLEGGDPTRPDVRPGPADDYWDHVDFVVDAAAERGITTALLPTWGSHWQVAPWQKRNNRRTPLGVIFNPENARVYGRWIGTRYRDRPVIWMLGGDRDVTTDADEAVIDAMAAGIREAVGDEQLITYHPSGLGRPHHARLFANEWLDFMTVQSGHGPCVDNAATVAANRARTPAKPVLDGEPNYEGITRGFKPASGRFDAREARRSAYRAVLAGAAGHTYGHNAVWQMRRPGDPPRFAATETWREALAAPGAGQMRHVRALAERTGWTTWRPRPEAVVGPCERSACVAAGERLIVYVSEARAVTVRDPSLTRSLTVETIDPRTGATARTEDHPGSAGGEVTFAAPSDLPADRVLIVTPR